MEDEPSPPKSNHKEELNLYFVPQLGLLTPVMIIENLISLLILQLIILLCNMPQPSHITVINFIIPYIHYNFVVSTLEFY